MKGVLITSCTNRKKVNPGGALIGRDLPSGSVRDVAESWLGRLESASDLVPVHDLYCGRSFTEAVAATPRLDLYVVSAGLGLVKAHDQVPSYSITVSGRGDDSLANKVSEFSANSWWAELRRSRFSRGSIGSQILPEEGYIAILALPKGYLSMVEADLLTLDSKLDSLRIVGVRPDDVAEPLRGQVIPIDERLDGPDSDLRGTKGDFAQRAARFFVEEILESNPAGSAQEHSDAVLALIRDWRVPERHARQRMSNEEIKSEIRAAWDIVEGKSTSMLRYFRDKKGLACEQTRFKNLFHEVAREMEQTV